MREALEHAEDDASVSDIAQESSSPVSSTGPSATRGSDAGCSCCPSLSESEHKLIQRKALLPSSKLQCQGGRWDEESQNSSSASGRIPVAHERVLWLVLVLASTMLCFTLLPLKTMSMGGSFASVATFVNNILATMAPQGPLLWRLQWRFQGGPDPRPLWQPDFLGPSAEWPHGSPAGFACAMGARQIRSVAVVGNGPLTDAQRQEIIAADRVVRFNAMNNRRIDERVDVWVVRNNAIPPYNFWGFQQLNDTEVEMVIQQAKAVLFLGGTRTHNQTKMADAVDQVLFWFSHLREEQVQEINFTGYWDVYNRVLSKNASSTIETAEAMPSSGLLGLLAVLSAVGPGVTIDMYGFNWSLKSYAAHKMNAEEQILRAVRQQYPDITIHPTACDGLYSCEELCDTGGFRLAVDEENCLRQVQKARAGKKVRFIDNHSMHNLGWHPKLHEEVEKLMPPESDDQALQESWLQKAVLVLEGDEDPPVEVVLPVRSAEGPAPAGDVEELKAAAGQSGSSNQLSRKLIDRKVKQL